MEREVGGGIGMGNTCKPMAVSFQCKTKFTTIKNNNNKKNIKKNIYIYPPNDLYAYSRLCGQQERIGEFPGIQMPRNRNKPHHQ